MINQDTLDIFTSIIIVAVLTIQIIMILLSKKVLLTKPKEENVRLKYFNIIRTVTTIGITVGWYYTIIVLINNYYKIYPYFLIGIMILATVIILLAYIKNQRINKKKEEIDVEKKDAIKKEYKNEKNK